MPASDDGGWQDTVVADRITIDQHFQERVQSAGLSTQAWELVMTAIEFEIVQPHDSDQAELVAKTDRLDSVLPAIRELESSRGQPAQPPTGPGIVDRLRGWLGGRRRDDTNRRAVAERLAVEYAAALQAHLEEHGKWQAVRARAAADAPERTD